MDRAEAIEHLELLKTLTLNVENLDVYSMAIAALREQEECEIRRHLKHFDIKEPRKTNADRIRAMTDEELVNVVPCPLGFSMFRCPVERQCGPCKREWLQQPVKEGADHEHK